MLQAAIDGEVELLLPGIVLDELERVLSGRLGFDDLHVRQARSLLERIAEGRPRAALRVEAVSRNPDDDAILACAVEAHADVLVTGDRRHLLPLGEVAGVRLLTPQALLAELAP